MKNKFKKLQEDIKNQLKEKGVSERYINMVLKEIKKETKGKEKKTDSNESI